MAESFLTKAPLSTASLEEEIARWRASGELGAVVTFAGVVRADETSDGRVTAIDFTAHEQMADEAIRALLERVCADTAGAEPEGVPTKEPRIFLRHRLGIVPVGECPIVIAVACGHRRRAFATCEGILEALKRDVPIWGRELLEEGSRWKTNH